MNPPAKVQFGALRNAADVETAEARHKGFPFEHFD